MVKVISIQFSRGATELKSVSDIGEMTQNRHWDPKRNDRHVLCNNTEPDPLGLNLPAWQSQRHSLPGLDETDAGGVLMVYLVEVD